MQLRLLDVPVDGGKLRVLQWGTGRRVALAVHGITASAMAWQAVARQMPPGWTLAAPDLRGRGYSASLPGPYGLERHAADVTAVLRHFGGSGVRPVLAGHSMGAYVARFAEIWASELREASKFGAALPHLYLTIRFEDLSAAPAPALEKVFRFLGVKTDAAIIEDCCAKGSFERLSGGRTPGQEDRGSFFRMGVAGDWPNHFGAETNRVFLEKAGEWLTQFGYS